MSNGYIQIPRSLIEHPSVKKAPAEQFKVLIVLLSHLRYLPELFDDHGLIFEVQKGEFCTTYDELGTLANVDRNHAVRAIRRFSEPTKILTFDKQIFESQILTYEVKRKKTLIKLLHRETYDLLLNQSEMNFDTKVKRSRNESEMQKNKDNKDKKENTKKEINKEKTKFLDFVFLSGDEHAKLIAALGSVKTQEFIESLNNHIGSKGDSYKSHYYTILNWVKLDKNRINGFHPKTATDRRTKNVDGSPVTSPADGRF